MQRIILPGEVGSTVEPRLTVDGLINMIGDLERAGRKPVAILVSEYDRRDLNQDLMGLSVDQVAKPDQAPDHDGNALGFILGVAIASHADISRGKARLVYPPVKQDVSTKLGGEGLIMVGA